VKKKRLGWFGLCWNVIHKKGASQSWSFFVDQFNRLYQPDFEKWAFSMTSDDIEKMVMEEWNAFFEREVARREKIMALAKNAFAVGREQLAAALEEKEKPRQN